MQLRFFVGTPIHTVSALIQWHFCAITMSTSHSSPHINMSLITGRALQETLSSGGSAGGLTDDDRTPRLAHMDVGLRSLLNAMAKAAQGAHGTARLIDAKRQMLDRFLSQRLLPVLDKAKTLNHCDFHACTVSGHL